MKLYRIIAIVKKEFLHILRDPRSLAMAIFLPMLMLILFGYALTLDVDNVPTVVWDQSSTVQSRDLISRFEGSLYFRVQSYADGYADIEKAIDMGDAIMAVIIPADFESQLSSGKPAPVQLLVDASDANTASFAMSYAKVVVMDYNGLIRLENSGRAWGASAPIELCARVWFNEEMVSRNFIIPGLIGVIMMIIAALLTSLTVAREWEMGMMEQLISTPVRSHELLIGKLIPYFIIGMVDVTISVLMGEYVFAVPLRGSVALLFGVAAVFVAGAMSLGILISVVTRSQLLASQLAILSTFLPSFLLSGLMFSISNMPTVLQFLSHLIPARYFVSVLKGIYLKGIGLEIIAAEVFFLLLFGVIVFGLANLRFKKKICV